MCSIKATMTLAAIIATALPSAVQAQDEGNARRGETIALQTCIACHSVRRNDVSTNPLAPAFTSIAAIRGMSATAINVALLSPHRDMPNIMLEPQERADIIAYILTLRR